MPVPLVSTYFVPIVFITGKYKYFTIYARDGHRGA